MSLNVFLNTRSREPSSSGCSQSCLNVLVALQHLNRPKFIEPMLSEATSGLNTGQGFSRSSRLMSGAPPVVMLITQSRAPLDAAGGSAETPRTLVGPAVLRIAGMQVDDGRARFGGADRGIGDLFGRDRQVRATSTGCGSTPVTAQVMMAFRAGIEASPVNRCRV